MTQAHTVQRLQHRIAELEQEVSSLKRQLQERDKDIPSKGDEFPKGAPITKPPTFESLDDRPRDDMDRTYNSIESPDIEAGD